MLLILPRWTGTRLRNTAHPHDHTSQLIHLLHSPLFWLAIVFALMVNTLHLGYLLAGERNLSATLAARLQEILKEEFLRLDAISVSYAGLFAGSENVTGSEFQAFSNEVLAEASHAIQAIYAPRVEHAQRADFEQKLLVAGAAYPFFYIPSAGREPTPVQPRDIYYPAQYLAFPRATGDLRGALLLGMGDMLIRTLAMTGTRTATDPFILHWLETQPIFNVFQALGIDELGPKGLVAISIDPQAVLSTFTVPHNYSVSLSMLNSNGEQVALLWYRGDLDADEDSFFYWSSSQVLHAFNRDFRLELHRGFGFSLAQWSAVVAMASLSLLGLILVGFVERARMRMIAAQTANRTKSEFLAVMSHEIRTPLNGVMGLASLLAESNLPPQEKKYAEIIVNSGQSLLQIINDILDYSKIEAGKLELEERVVILDELIEEIQALFGFDSANSAVAFSASLSPDCPPCLRTDPTRLRQILQNLLGNARKFTQHGEIVLRVEPDADTLRFSVRDTGIGINEEQQNRLFKPFSQADMSVARRFGGTGLGLNICRQLTDLLGGEIGVNSVPGEGSEFWVTLPKTCYEPTPSSVSSTTADLHDVRVLIVDDYDTARLILSEQCRKLGMLVETAIDVAEAWLKIEQARFDVIITDCHLPAVDGETFVTQLAENEQTDSIPVLLLTASSSAITRKFNENALVYTGAKPTSYRQMASLLHRYLPRSLLVSSLSVESEPLKKLSLYVLVAEDNTVNGMVIHGMLEKLGHRVELCTDGQQALALVQADHGLFDVVLMDCEMPVMDGFAASRAVRAFEQEQSLTAVPIIALTAHTVADSRSACLDSGMNDVISKPVSIELLERTLREQIIATA